MTLRWRSVAGMAAVLVVMSACGSADDDPDVIDDGVVPPPPEIAGTAWQFVAGGGSDGDVVLVDDFPITIRFDDARLGGTAACNTYSAGYQLDGYDLVIGDLIQTEIGCELDVMAAEAAYLAALSGVTEVTISGGSMVLGGIDGELSFEPQPDP